MQTTVLICLTVCIVVAMATRPCCMPEEYEGQYLWHPKLKVNIITIFKNVY